MPQATGFLLECLASDLLSKIELSCIFWSIFQEGQVRSGNRTSLFRKKSSLNHVYLSMVYYVWMLLSLLVEVDLLRLYIVAWSPLPLNQVAPMLRTRNDPMPILHPQQNEVGDWVYSRTAGDRGKVSYVLDDAD
jgi:hypothetical protein